MEQIKSAIRGNIYNFIVEMLSNMPQTFAGIVSVDVHAQYCGRHFKARPMKKAGMEDLSSTVRTRRMTLAGYNGCHRKTGK